MVYMSAQRAEPVFPAAHVLLLDAMFGAGLSAWNLVGQDIRCTATADSASYLSL